MSKLKQIEKLKSKHKKIEKWKLKYYSRKAKWRCDLKRRHIKKLKNNIERNFLRKYVGSNIDFCFLFAWRYWELGALGRTSNPLLSRVNKLDNS